MAGFPKHIGNGEILGNKRCRTITNNFNTEHKSRHHPALQYLAPSPSRIVVARAAHQAFGFRSVVIEDNMSSVAPQMQNGA
jgi:hypothetical protein